MVTAFSRTLFHWYEENKRDLPWRRTKNPYVIWLSEIILQQTRVQQGQPYFERYLEKFPTIRDLADAREDEVLKLWQGLGYYSRARNLHKTAQIIQRDYGGIFPSRYEEVIRLPGIGDYTASAILSFAFNQEQVVLDGNVARFATRYLGILDPVEKPKVKQQIKDFFKSQIPPNEASVFNQAIMEYGALECTFQNPACGRENGGCVFESQCYALRHQMVRELPVKSKSVQVKERDMHFILLYDKDGIYMRKRTGDDIWLGLYQIYEAGDRAGIQESPVEIRFFRQYTHLLSHRKLNIRFYTCRLESKKHPFEDLDTYIHVPFSEIGRYAVPKPVEKFFEDFKLLTKIGK